MIIMMIIIIVIIIIIIIVIIINNYNNNNNNNNNNDSNSESIKNYNWTFILSHGYVDSVGSRPTITAKYVRNNHKSSII